MLWTTRRPAAAVSAAAQPRTPPLAPVLSAFWRPFTETGDAPIVIFSNAEFTGRPETGMHYFVRGKDKPGEILDHYTGVGEVLAVGELTRIFGRLNSAVRVKRGRLLSLDDARNNDIILLGSPAENPVLRDLHPNRHFVFSPSAGPARKGDLAIRNVNPKDGEPREFLASAGLPIQEDYALVALHPGLTERKWILALAGTTTFGTQAAAEFVSHADSVQELLTRTGTPAGASPSPFEAVVQIEIAGGVPVKTRIVAIRQR
jgi:hypothetical protein